MFGENDLKDLRNYLMLKAKELREDENITDDSECENIEELGRLLESIRYNPMLFKDAVEEYKISDILENPSLDDLPLHINDKGLLSRVLVKWRLEKGV